MGTRRQQSEEQTGHRFLRTKRPLLVLVLALAIVLVVTGVALATISFGSASTPVRSTSTTIQLAAPSSTALNDLLLAQITYNHTGHEQVPITMPAGWVQIVNTATSQMGQALFYKVAGASEPSTYSFTVYNSTQSAAAEGTILRYTGVDTSSPIYNYSANSGGSGSQLTASTVNALANSMIVAFFGTHNAVFISIPTNTTNRAYPPGDIVAPNLRAVDQAITSAGATGNRVSTAGSSTPWVAHLVALRPANTAPVANNDSYSTQTSETLTVNAASGVLANDTDIDGNSLTAVKLTDPTLGTLTAFNSNGSFTYVAGASTGTDSFTYHAYDGALYSNTVTVTIRISNHPAVTATNDSYSTNENATLSVTASGGPTAQPPGPYTSGLLTNDSEDGDYCGLAVKVTDPAHGTLTAFNSDGSFTYVPFAYWNGTDSFTYKQVDDGSIYSNVATVTVTVNPVNCAPVVVGEAYETNQDAGILITLQGSDVDGDSLTYTIDSGPSHGSLGAITGGQVVYTPADGYYGADSFTYHATDSPPNPLTPLSSNTGTVDITVYYAPTAAVVSSFGAVLDHGNVVVTWDTASEASTAGYYLQRLDSRTGRWATVNHELIPAMFESPAGGSYAVVDPDAAAGGELTYRLREMERTGSANIYGPFTVIAKSGTVKADLSRNLGTGEKAARTALPVHITAAPPWSDSRVQSLRAPAPTDQLCIEVAKSGLYRLDAVAIAAALGLQAKDVKDMIKGNKFALTSLGHTVGLMPAADNSALFFYGQAIDSIYTSTNVYWLTRGKATLMASAKPVSSAGAVRTTFIDKVHAEREMLDNTANFHDPEGDFWIWDYMIAGNSQFGAKTFAVEVPGVVVRGIQLVVTLQGLTTTGVVNEHHAQIKLNGVTLGDVRWSGLTSKSVGLAIPGGVLMAGGNQVEVVSLRDAGVPYSWIGLDSVDITFERTTTSVADQVSLRVPSAGPVRVDGLSGNAAWVFDLADPLLPKLVKINAVGSASGTSWVQFVTGSAGQDYLVATAAGALPPQAMTATAPGTLRAKGRGAEYVVITTPALRASAQLLADYRAGQGLATAVVTTFEIYNEFSSGLVTPHAIQDFIQYALRNWRPAPRFVVLAGDGSYNYKNDMPTNDCLVPPLMVDTESGITPSDVHMADVIGGDGVPDVAIGRIPVASVIDFDAYIEKVIAYESATGTWRQTALMVADNADPEAGDFPVDSDFLAGLLPSAFQVQKLYLGDLTIAQVRSGLLGNLTPSEGSLLVNYVGHGGPFSLADESILTMGDVDVMSNSPRLPVVSALTCLFGQFGMPGMDGLGESLVKRARGGAIAVWAPSTMEDNAESVLLGEHFFQALFSSSRSVRLGEAVRAASHASAHDGAAASLLQTYNLLGDPALRVWW